MDSSLTSVVVNLDHARYEIIIGDEELNRIESHLQGALSNRHLIVISDSNVAPIYLEPVQARLNQVASNVDTLVIPAGEASKSVEEANRLWQALVELSADRSSVIVALGGGVVGDLAGFLAATYMRGIDFIQIPTSLLAQVDSSVGGKTGINLPHGKNLVGSFLQPKLVVVSTSTLATLDQANFRAGMAEVIKYGSIMDADFFQWLEDNVTSINNRDSVTLAEMIATCCRCKAQVVEQDEKETSGRRAILNYGHTFGHAIESVFGYGSYLHGEAIAIGMTCAAKMGLQLGMVDEAFVKRQTQLLKAFDLPTDCPTEKHNELLASMKKDKKSSAGKVKLILPNRIGHVELVPWPGDDAVLAALV
jgi:3-dehydroquinate synthase